MHMAHKVCGSEPAREYGASVDEDVVANGAFASRLAPTLESVVGKKWIKKGPHPAKETALENKICHRAVITDNLVIPARSIEAMARATSP
jgi:hypothetical protein